MMVPMIVARETGALGEVSVCRHAFSSRPGQLDEDVFQCCLFGVNGHQAVDRHCVADLISGGGFVEADHLLSDSTSIPRSDPHRALAVLEFEVFRSVQRFDLSLVDERHSI